MVLARSESSSRRTLLLSGATLLPTTLCTSGSAVGLTAFCADATRSREAAGAGSFAGAASWTFLFGDFGDACAVTLDVSATAAATGAGDIFEAMAEPPAAEEVVPVCATAGVLCRR